MARPFTRGQRPALLSLKAAARYGRDMKPRFPGFPSEARKFLKQLKRNNNRDWFIPRKSVYEEKVKAPMTELVLALGEAMHDFVPELVADPQKAIYRIYRDVRFSKDKSPYKTWIAAVFPPRGHEKHAGAGTYFHLTFDEILVAGGVYAPGPKELLAIRRHIAARDGELRAVLKDRSFRRLFGEMTGEKLTRAPKGFPADHPAVDLLIFKQFLAWKTLDPALAETSKLYTELVKHFRGMMPFLRFLNAPLKPAKAGT